MRNKKAKQIRRIAEDFTIGKSKRVTRKLYRKLKAEYKFKKRHPKQNVAKVLQQDVHNKLTTPLRQAG